MATTWQWINNMKLRYKLSLIYTIAFTVILAITFISIYSFSERYRKEEFYKRLSDRTVTTFKISIQVDQINNATLHLFDQNTVNTLSEQRVLLFDDAKKVIYSSSDTGQTADHASILAHLGGDETRYEGSLDKYELLALKFQNKGQTYYGIAQAYDKFGIRKIRFLGILLTVTFFAVTILIALLSILLSNIITRPISRLTSDVERISPDDLKNRVWAEFSNDEIGFLANEFNLLLDKVENAFKFQLHYINHLSHELKTPLAIMMANAERSLTENETEKLKSSLQFQKNAIMELSNIINAMLDISKMEKKLTIVGSETIRIDEILFECLDEITFLNKDINFDLDIDEAIDERDLTIRGNSRMIKMVMMNLVKNAVNFSDKERPSIAISAKKREVQVRIVNDGETLDMEETSKLFLHSFRGKNSRATKGFGLGLVLAHRIVEIHKGSIEYSVTENDRNCFVLVLHTAM